MTEPLFERGTERTPGPRPRAERDTWRDPDADSGLRLDHWLNETQDASRTLRMSRDGTGFGWTVVMIEGNVEVSRGSDGHVDQAWSKALDKLAEAQSE